MSGEETPLTTDEKIAFLNEQVEGLGEALDILLDDMSTPGKETNAVAMSCNVRGAPFSLIIGRRDWAERIDSAAVGMGLKSDIPIVDKEAEEGGAPLDDSQVPVNPKGE